MNKKVWQNQTRFVGLAPKTKLSLAIRLAAGFLDWTKLLVLKGNRGEDAVWPENAHDVHTLQSVGFIGLCCQYLYKAFSYF